MDKKKLIEELNRFRQDPRTKEAIGEAGCLKDPESAAVLFANLAEKLGYDLKEEDILSLFNDEKEQRIARTEETAAEIENLSDDEIDQAAGGRENDACSDTFKNKENCWFNDGCDAVVNNYDGYVCSSTAWFCLKGEEYGFFHCKQQTW